MQVASECVQHRRIRLLAALTVAATCQHRPARRRGKGGTLAKQARLADACCQPPVYSGSCAYLMKAAWCTLGAAWAGGRTSSITLAVEATQEGALMGSNRASSNMR